MTFRSPEWLWLLALLPVALLLLILRERQRRSLANRFVSESLRRSSPVPRGARPFLVALALAAAVVAYAGPRWGHETVEVRGSSANRIVVLDASNSMMAEDVGTTRLIAAKAVAGQVIESHQGKVALIVFEGTPQIVSPLTTDADAVSTLLESIEPGESGEPGSNIGAALREALKLVDVRNPDSTDVVLISDGEERGGDAVEAAQEAAGRKIPIRTVTIGTAEGASIPLHDEGGNAVVTKADAGLMAEISRASGGRTFANPFGASMMRELALSSHRGESSASEQVEIPIERFQWALGAALACFFAASVTHRGAE